MIKTGSTIGILGGGQLGKMLAQAASQLGYHTHIYCPVAESPAFQVATEVTQAEYDDLEALEKFAKSVDVVTFEFENVPSSTIEYLENKVTVRPNRECLHISQNRLIEKEYAQSLGIPVTPFQKVTNVADLKDAVEKIECPCILKTVVLGYDGNGQIRIDSNSETDEIWNRFGKELGIVEAFVPFEKELSVIIARTPEGAIRAYSPVENIHQQGILRTTLAPAQEDTFVIDRAIEYTTKLAEALDIVGLLAVEYFLKKDGELVFNEMAPRPHNSGHWTLDGAATSQFEQHIRAICGLPLGDPSTLRPIKMENLLGFEVDKWVELMKNDEAKVYLYGKKVTVDKRKMGHVNYLV